MQEPMEAEGVGSPGAGVIGRASCLTWMLRTEFSSSARPAFAFNLSPTSPAPVNII